MRRNTRVVRVGRIIMRTLLLGVLLTSVAVDSMSENAMGVAWGTYLGGAGEDRGRGIAVDSSGNVYATGNTVMSLGWVSGGWDTTLGGGYDGYVVKLDTSGAHLWSLCLLW